VNGLTCAFTGRLGGDPELRYTQQGKRMLTFSVAVDQQAAESRPVPEVIWVKVTAWEDQAAELEGRLAKGTPVYCEGRLQHNNWTGADGAERSGLSLSAWVVQPMGQIGRRRATAAPTRASYQAS
jgi:single-strand DNA-binding protein